VGISTSLAIASEPSARDNAIRSIPVFLSTLNCGSKIPIRSGLSTSCSCLVLLQAVIRV